MRHRLRLSLYMFFAFKPRWVRLGVRRQRTSRARAAAAAAACASTG